MIGSTRALRVYAYGAPVDMRKGFDGLAALVRQGFDKDPVSGDMFLFVSRNRIRAKVLLWDGTGLCLYAKRLEEGRFARLWRQGESKEIELTQSELQLYLEGCQEVAKRSLSPPEIDPQRPLFTSNSMLVSGHGRWSNRAGHRASQSSLSADRSTCQKARK